MNTSFLFVMTVVISMMSANANAWWAGSWQDNKRSNESAASDMASINQEKMSREQYNAHIEYTKEIDKIQRNYQSQAETARTNYNKKMQQWYK